MKTLSRVLPSCVWQSESHYEQGQHVQQKCALLFIGEEGSNMAAPQGAQIQSKRSTSVASTVIE